MYFRIHQTNYIISYPQSIYQMREHTGKQTNEIIKEKVGSIHKDFIDRIKEDRDWIERTYDLKAEMLEKYVPANSKKGTNCNCRCWNRNIIR